MKLILSAFLSLFFSINAIAADILPMFEALKNRPVDYEPMGQICEQVAREQLLENYPKSQYHITIGIEYSVSRMTIGELDVVVIDSKTQDVILVAEVKCWRNMDGGLKKAKEQRARFIRTLQKQGSSVRYYAHEGGNFRSEQFKKTKFIAIAQNGSEEHGFDVGLDFTLRELMELRDMLLRCQASKQCPRPEK